MFDGELAAQADRGSRASGTEGGPAREAPQDQGVFHEGQKNQECRVCKQPLMVNLSG